MEGISNSFKMLLSGLLYVVVLNAYRGVVWKVSLKFWIPKICDVFSTSYHEFEFAENAGFF